MQKSRKITSSTSSTSTRPEQLAERPGRKPQLLGDDLLPALLGRVLCARERAQRSRCSVRALALARDQRRLGREKRSGKRDQRVDQFVHALPRSCRNKVNGIRPRTAIQFFVLRSCPTRSILLTTNQIAVPGGTWIDRRAQHASAARSRVASSTHSTRSAPAACSPRAAHALLLDRVVGLADAGGVEQRHRIAAEIEMHLDARRAWSRETATRSPPRAAPAD